MTFSLIKNSILRTQNFYQFTSTRKYHPHFELIRLRQNSNILRRLELIQDLGYRKLWEDRLIAFGRSLEQFEIFKNSHYVFHHGQASNCFLALNVLKNFLTHWNQCSNISKFECQLRHPSGIKQLDHQIHTVEWYTSRINIQSMKEHNDAVHGNALVAADGYLASTELSESALSFFSSNSLNYVTKEIKLRALSEIARYHILDNKFRQFFIGEFNKINDKIIIERPGGILYTICIPKPLFRQCGYLSEPFGIPAKITKSVEETLEEMQNEVLPNKVMPQVRLLSHKLDKAKIFMFSTLPDEELEVLMQKIKNLIEGNLKYFTFDQ